MRDSFGGVFMIRLLLVFIVIYVSFTAVSLNYAKAFRIKNKIIDVIEQNEVTDLKKWYKKNSSKIDKVLKDTNYNKKCKNGNGEISKSKTFKGICHNGIVITINKKTKEMITYDIYTYADWNLGALNMLLALAGNNKSSEEVIEGSWEIAGQARVKIK